jgi:hypothetical protein
MVPKLPLIFHKPKTQLKRWRRSLFKERVVHESKEDGRALTEINTRGGSEGNKCKTYHKKVH